MPYVHISTPTIILMEHVIVSKGRDLLIYIMVGNLVQ